MAVLPARLVDHAGSFDLLAPAVAWQHRGARLPRARRLHSGGIVAGFYHFVELHRRPRRRAGAAFAPGTGPHSSGIRWARPRRSSTRPPARRASPTDDIDAVPLSIPRRRSRRDSGASRGFAAHPRKRRRVDSVRRPAQRLMRKQRGPLGKGSADPGCSGTSPRIPSQETRWRGSGIRCSASTRRCRHPARARRPPHLRRKRRCRPGHTGREGMMPPSRSCVAFPASKIVCHTIPGTDTTPTSMPSESSRLDGRAGRS